MEKTKIVIRLKKNIPFFYAAVVNVIKTIFEINPNGVFSWHDLRLLQGLDPCKNRKKMDEKIKMVKNYLPEFLVENRSLYAILSTGVHDLMEDECLQYFETVKIGIEQILDEKIIQKEKVDKTIKARETIQKIHGKLTNSE